MPKETSYFPDRKLHRPRLAWWQAAGVVCLSEGTLWGLSFALHDMLRHVWNITMPPSAYHCILSAAFLLLAGRWFLIMAVLLYQRYAPEHVRQKCVCTPTCSEYALLALRKYVWLRGGYKTYIRLTRTCQGKKHIIDYP